MVGEFEMNKEEIIKENRRLKKLIDELRRSIKEYQERNLKLTDKESLTKYLERCVFRYEKIIDRLLKL